MTVISQGTQFVVECMENSPSGKLGGSSRKNAEPNWMGASLLLINQSRTLIAARQQQLSLVIVD